MPHINAAQERLECHSVLSSRGPGYQYVCNAKLAEVWEGHDAAQEQSCASKLTGVAQSAELVERCVQAGAAGSPAHRAGLQWAAQVQRQTLQHPYLRHCAPGMFQRACNLLGARGKAVPSWCFAQRARVNVQHQQVDRRAGPVEGPKQACLQKLSPSLQALDRKRVFASSTASWRPAQLECSARTASAWAGLAWRLAADSHTVLLLGVV